VLSPGANPAAEVAKIGIEKIRAVIAKSGTEA
jgi:hypothetical protein